MATLKGTVVGITAIPQADGSVPIRREIRDFNVKFPDQWNLYLLGLAEFQKAPPADLLSYYQLAGIHGEPYVPWNNVGGLQNPTSGYCTHSSILFLTWHRPYLALYEQVLYATVQRIAGQFPQTLRARYVEAAKGFRMPYWDWATKTTGQTTTFPTIFTSPTVPVVGIDGTTKQINNPLFSFRFDDKTIPKNLALSRSWTQYPTTVRSPDRKGNSQNALVSRVLSNESASLRTNLALVLLSYKRFDAFSQQQWAADQSPGEYGSLEDLHNEIHDKIGQGGHMGSLATSAFDPVFWLHHTNVDRLWDIWQALNPDSYVIDKVATRQEANFFIAANTRINATTDLKPFYDASATKFWTSAGVKYTTPFGYAYPETQRWLFSSNTAYQADVRAKVTNEYGANVINNFFTNIAPEIAKDTVPIQTASLKQGALIKSVVKEATQHPIVAAQQILAQLPQQVNSPKPVVEAKPKNSRSDSAQTAVASASATPVDAQTPPPSSPTPATTVPLYVPSQFAHLVKDRTYTEWITNLRTIKHALSQTFRVYIFLGDFNPDPTTWPTEYNVVGRFTVLGRDTSTACSKCKVDRENELVVTGTVPLTSALLQDIVDGQLASLEPSDVQLYLEKHLHWRATLFDGSEVAREDVPGLKVGVVSTEVKIAADGLPVYSGVYAQYPGITDGRPAGLRAGDAV